MNVKLYNGDCLEMMKEIPNGSVDCVICDLPYETVLDFTFSSCSTGVACLNTNRKFIGIELDKQYFDIATKRIC